MGCWSCDKDLASLPRVVPAACCCKQSPPARTRPQRSARRRLCLAIRTAAGARVPPPPPTLPADSWLEIEAHHPPPPPLECTPSFHFSQPGGCCVPPLAPTATDAQGRAPATSLAAAPPPFLFASGAARRPEMLGRTTTTGPLEPVCAMCTTDWGGRARTHRPPARDLRVQGLHG